MAPDTTTPPPRGGGQEGSGATASTESVTKDTHAADRTVEFIEAVFPPEQTKALPVCIQLWSNRDKKMRPFKAAEGAASWLRAESAVGDVYMAAGVCPKPPNMKAQTARTKASQVVGIPGVWADIDVNGGPEGKTSGAPSVDAAISLAREALPPTLIVHSGYGIQAWWLLDELWLFTGEHREAEREQAARMVAAFQAELRARGRARESSWVLDSVPDLARVMRVPGGMNHKGADKGIDPVPVMLLEHDAGARYSVEDLSRVASARMAEVAAAATMGATGAGVDISLGRDINPPMLKIDALIEADPDFEHLWRRKPRKASERDWSQSSYDLALVNALVTAGFSDQEIAECLRYHRARANPSDPKLHGRDDYYRMTIGKVRREREEREAAAERELMQTAAADEMASIASSDAPASKARVASLFTQVLGGPEVVELIQESRDPDNARYKVALADGTEVPIGPPGNLLSIGKFRERFMAVTGHVIPNVKVDKWHKVVQALIRNAQVHESPEDSPEARAMAYVRAYVAASGGMSKDIDAACENKDPFEKDGKLYIHLTSLWDWVQRAGEREMRRADLRSAMRAAGFGPNDVIAYTSRAGRNQTIRYMAIDLSLAEDVDA